MAIGFAFSVSAGAHVLLGVPLTGAFEGWSAAAGRSIAGSRASWVVTKSPGLGRAIRMRYDRATMRRPRLLRLPIGL